MFDCMKFDESAWDKLLPNYRLIFYSESYFHTIVINIYEKCCSFAGLGWVLNLHRCLKLENLVSRTLLWLSYLRIKYRCIGSTGLIMMQRNDNRWYSWRHCTSRRMMNKCIVSKWEELVLKILSNTPPYISCY